MRWVYSKEERGKIRLHWWTSTCNSNNETRKILIETGSGFRYSKAVIYFLFVLRTINTFLTARYFSSGACLDMTNFAFSVFRFLNIFRDLQGKYFHMYSFCDWVKKRLWAEVSVICWLMKSAAYCQVNQDSWQWLSMDLADMLKSCTLDSV